MACSSQTQEEQARAGAGPFFALTLGLAVPFWLLGALAPHDIMPGLPISALMVICPAAAAFALKARKGKKALAALAARAWDFARVRNPIWFFVALAAMPAASVLMMGASLALGVSVPAPEWNLAQVLALSALFFAAAMLEELGWSGYVLDPLAARRGDVGAALLIGLVWVIFHLPALAQAERSLQWIAWWSLGAIAIRVIMVWLYMGAGRSVFVVALFHMSQNVSWQLYPVRGSYYDPLLFAIIVSAAALTVVVLCLARAPAGGVSAPRTRAQSSPTKPPPRQV
jgi:membrane protease YdiL (CAAX protease family)